MANKLKTISNYLDDPIQNPLQSPQNDQELTFLITFLGAQFIQGYRIVEKISQNLLVMSLMEYNDTHHNHLRLSEGLSKQYRVICLQIDDNQLNKAQVRKQLFYDIKTVVCQLGISVQAILVQLHTFKYSFMNVTELQRGETPTFKKFYKPQSFLPQKNGKRTIAAPAQGTHLHALIQTMIKGMGRPRNKQQFMAKIICNHRFFYNLSKVLHTFYYIVGQQAIQHDYIVISAEKWVRKTTIKQFKRPDFFLRNQDQVGIIDWKFSNKQAKNIMEDHKGKSKLYYELARKDYNCKVNLWYYCIHRAEWGIYHHKFSRKLYNPLCEQVTLRDDRQQCEELQDQDNNNTEQCQVNISPEERSSSIIFSHLQPNSLQAEQHQQKTNNPPIQYVCIDD